MNAVLERSLPSTSVASSEGAEVRAERALQQTATASLQLADAFTKLPLRIENFEFSSPEESWKENMKNFEFIAKHISIFVKSIPGYNELPVKTRCSLFSNSILPIALAEANRTFITPGTMTSHNAEQFYKHFPEYRVRAAIFFCFDVIFL